MKKLLHFLILMQICFAISAQDTLVAYKFNVTNSNVPTTANSYNTGGLLLRESAYTSPYTFPTGNGSFCLTSGEWMNAMNTSGGYYTMFSSMGRKNIFISSRQESSPTGPRDFKLQYKVGVAGSWADVLTNNIRCSSTNFIIGGVSHAPLPSVCDNQPSVYLRWVVISDSNTTGGLIDINGTSSIDNVMVLSVLIEANNFMDINQIKANIHDGGVNFYGTSTTFPEFGMAFPSFEYPQNSGSHTIFSSALWIGGKNLGNLYLAGERYHGNGYDYNPGPVMDSVQAESEMVNWNNVWKINKSEIDYHIAHWNSPGYVMPQSISQWPVYANPGLGINNDLAPYVDADSDGFYIPSHGDYPKIRGDQAIYYIFNDSVYKHTETGGKRLGVEVHAMAYAYNTDPLLEKIIFMNYLVYNRSARVYDSLYLGLFTDLDIGYPKDDYVGCDTLLETYYGYNGDNFDETAEGQVGYGNNPPVQTVTFLNQPLSSFFFCNNTAGGLEAITDPELPSEYYNFMTGHWKDGKHVCYGGLGHPAAGGDSTKPVNYMFPGNPNDTTQWSDAQAGNPPYDRRGIGITGPLTLVPGQFISFDVAYITVDSGFAKSVGFPNIDNMLATVPLVRDFFNNNLPQNGHDLALGIETNNSNPVSAQFNVYPNPSHDRITFTTNLSNSKLSLDILDINGRLIRSYVCQGSKKEMDVSGFKNGVYILKISSAEQSSFVKFIKM